MCLKTLNEGVFNGLWALRLWISILSHLCCTQPPISLPEVAAVDWWVLVLCKFNQVPELCVRWSSSLQPSSSLSVTQLPSSTFLPASSSSQSCPSFTCQLLPQQLRESLPRRPQLRGIILFLEATPHNAVLTFPMIFIPSQLFHVYPPEGMVCVLYFPRISSGL